MPKEAVRELDAFEKDPIRWTITESTSAEQAHLPETLTPLKVGMHTEITGTKAITCWRLLAAIGFVIGVFTLAVTLTLLPAACAKQNYRATARKASHNRTVQHQAP